MCLSSSYERLFAVGVCATEEPRSSTVRLKCVPGPTVFGFPRAGSAPPYSPSVFALGSGVAEFAPALEAEECTCDVRAPEPAGEVVSDGVRRGIRVTAVGGKPPEVDLELGKGVQSAHQAEPNIPVKRVALPREHERGKLYEVLAGAWFDQAEDKWSGRQFLVVAGRVPGNTDLRQRCEACLEPAEPQLGELVPCCLGGGGTRLVSSCALFQRRRWPVSRRRADRAVAEEESSDLRSLFGVFDCRIDQALYEIGAFIPDVKCPCHGSCSITHA
jgi:hypothetical protein